MRIPHHKISLFRAPLANVYQLLFTLAGTIIIISVAINDFKNTKHKYWDFEFRRAGARLLDKGYNPYFLGKNANSLNNFDSIPCCNLLPDQSLVITASTAPPLVHLLLIPISFLPLEDAGIIWTCIQYILMLLLTIMAVKRCTHTHQAAVVVTSSLLFLLTPAWNHHTSAGQIYIVIPFLCMLFLYTFCKAQIIGYAIIAGAIATITVLIRPNTIVFFPLFLLLQKKWATKNLIAFYTTVLIICLSVFAPPSQIPLWKSYQKNVNAQILFHQGLTAEQIKAPKNIPTQKHVISKKSKTVKKGDSENGNFFVTYYKIFDQKISLNVLYILSAISVFSVSLFYYLNHRKENSFTIENISFASYALYMITDLFSPIYRHQYYTIQWLFPLLLAGAFYNKINKIVLLMLVLGTILNVTTLRIIPIRHTLGEYLFLAASFVLAMSKYKLETKEIQLKIS
jgi:hypothetical protein